MARATRPLAEAEAVAGAAILHGGNADRELGAEGVAPPGGEADVPGEAKALQAMRIWSLRA